MKKHQQLPRPQKHHLIIDEYQKIASLLPHKHQLFSRNPSSLGQKKQEITCSSCQGSFPPHLLQSHQLSCHNKYSDHEYYYHQDSHKKRPLSKNDNFPPSLSSSHKREPSDSRKKGPILRTNSAIKLKVCSKKQPLPRDKGKDNQREHLSNQRKQMTESMHSNRPNSKKVLHHPTPSKMAVRSGTNPSAELNNIKLRKKPVLPAQLSKSNKERTQFRPLNRKRNIEVKEERVREDLKHKRGMEGEKMARYLVEQEVEEDLVGYGRENKPNRRVRMEGEGEIPTKVVNEREIQREIERQRERAREVQAERQRLRERERQRERERVVEEGVIRRHRRQQNESRPREEVRSNNGQREQGTGRGNTRRNNQNNHRERDRQRERREPNRPQRSQNQQQNPRNVINFVSQTLNEQLELMNNHFSMMTNIFSNFSNFVNVNIADSSGGRFEFTSGPAFDHSDDYTDSSSDLQGSSSYDQEEYAEYSGEQFSEEGPEGMDEDELRSIPVRKFRGGIDGSHQCTICLMELKNNDEVKRLYCEHIFHGECIDEWLRRKSACPVCRDSLGAQ